MDSDMNTNSLANIHSLTNANSLTNLLTNIILIRILMFNDKDNIHMYSFIHIETNLDSLLQDFQHLFI